MRWAARYKAWSLALVVAVGFLAFALALHLKDARNADQQRFIKVFRSAENHLLDHFSRELRDGHQEETLRRAQELFEECTRLVPERPEPFLRLCEIHLRQMQTGAASLALDQALQRGGVGYCADTLASRIAGEEGLVLHLVPREARSSWSELDLLALADAAYRNGRGDYALDVLLDPSFVDELSRPAMLIGVCAQEDFVRFIRGERMKHFAGPEVALRTAVNAYSSAVEDMPESQTALDNLTNVLYDRLRFISGLADHEIEAALDRLEGLARILRRDGDVRLQAISLATALFCRVEHQRAGPEVLRELREILAGFETGDVLALTDTQFIAVVQMIALVLDPGLSLNLLRSRDFGPHATAAGPFHLLVRIVEEYCKTEWYEPDIERLEALGNSSADWLAPADLDAGYALLETLARARGSRTKEPVPD